MRFLVVLAADSGDAFVPAEGRQVCIRTQSIPHLVQGDSFDQRCVQDITLGDGNVPGEPLHPWILRYHHIGDVVLSREPRYSSLVSIPPTRLS